jgi:hypothetical protein
MKNDEQKSRPLTLGFSTADAEQPEIKYEKGTLHLIFKDWQDKLVKLQFEEALAFSWASDDPVEEVSEIENSEWIKALSKDWSPEDLKDKRHFMVSFNAVGTLNVVSKHPALLA